MTILPRVYYTGRGELAFKTAELFKKYNTSILRISPNELLFNDPQAWKDIYGHRTTGAPELPKHPGKSALLYTSNTAFESSHSLRHSKCAEIV